jgi:hypothetical protein
MWQFKNTPKAQATKIINFGASKNIINKVKRQST